MIHCGCPARHSLWGQTWSYSCSANETFGTLWPFIFISRCLIFWSLAGHSTRPRWMRLMLSIGSGIWKTKEVKGATVSDYSQLILPSQNHMSMLTRSCCLIRHFNMKSCFHSLWAAGLQTAHHERLHSTTNYNIKDTQRSNGAVFQPVWFQSVVGKLMGTDTAAFTTRLSKLEIS